MTPSGLTALKRHEGFRARPYRDTAGKLTIGYGRNLDDNPLKVSEANFLLSNDVAQATADVLLLCPTFATLTPARQDVLINMCFNMGAYRLSGFKRMWAAIALEDWTTAAMEMLDSKWHNDTGYRAQELATLMSLGDYT